MPGTPIWNLPKRKTWAPPVWSAIGSCTSALVAICTGALAYQTYRSVRETIRHNQIESRAWVGLNVSALTKLTIASGKVTMDVSFELANAGKLPAVEAWPYVEISTAIAGVTDPSPAHNPPNYHMASDGTGCFPSYALIADESGLSRSAVIYHVEKAGQAGFLQIENRTRDNGSASSNMYLPTMPGGSAPYALGGARDALGGGAPDASLITTYPSNNHLPPLPQRG